MLIYSILMCSVTALLLSLGIAVYKGKTNLIHSYHQIKVTDPSAYGKAFGKAMFVTATAPLLSGLIGIEGDSKLIAFIAVAVLLIGTGIGMGCIIAVQKKYNQGIF
ncbi:MAG: hypothetical protein ACI3YH_01580 [Eubacteriales bacterium]